MSLEARKINLINWISSVQETDIIDKIEKIQNEKTDWWDTINREDRQAIEEGLEQLDKGEFLTRSQVRNRIKEKFNF
ncbi:hypothetical protein [Roseimarinus sediminis]|uniref:hypothetical protein n=1 Tax=Roseimarinus sediminis TaxID=1610899 RepID=UPI003D1B0444